MNRNTNEMTNELIYSTLEHNVVTISHNIDVFDLQTSIYKGY